MTWEWCHLGNLRGACERAWAPGTSQAWVLTLPLLFTSCVTFSLILRVTWRKKDEEGRWWLSRKAFAGLSWCEHSLLHACPRHKLCPFGGRFFPTAPGPPTFRSGLFLFPFPLVLLVFSEPPAFYGGKAVLAQGKELWTWTRETKLWTQALPLTDYWHFGKRYLASLTFNINISEMEMIISLPRIIVRMDISAQDIPGTQ